MKVIRRRDGTMAEVSDDYILQNGESWTIPSMMMDSARHMVRDARGEVAGSRPGFLIPDSDVAHAVRETVYRQYASDIEQRWQSGRWQSQPSKPVASAPQTFENPEAAEAARLASYEQYRADLEARWRR